MRKFFVKLLLFALPFLLVLGTPFGLAVYSGEMLPIDMVEQIKEQVGIAIYSPPTPDMVFAYKLRTIQERRPAVLVTGSSRMFMFRDGLFHKDPGAFYNASGGNWMLHDMIALIDQLDAASAPDILIVGLDQRIFNAAEAYAWRGEINYTYYDLQGGDVGDIFSATFRQLLAREIQPGVLLRRAEPVYGQPALGIDAIQNGRGFRISDGSMQWGSIILEPHIWEERRAVDIEHLANGTDYLLPGDTVDTQSLDDLTTLLELAQEKGITVVGIMPPFTQPIYTGIVEGGRHAYYRQSQPLVAQRFAAFDFPYFDFSDGAALGIPDAEFFDGWHLTELGTLRLYLALVRALPDLFAPYTDAAYLEQIAAQSPYAMTVFDPIPQQLVAAGYAGG